MHSLDVWESREDAERFCTERMMPALQQQIDEGGPPLSFQEFELPWVKKPLPTMSTPSPGLHVKTLQTIQRELLKR